MFPLSNSSHYSVIDRWLHNLAFGSKLLQNVMADLEESLLASTWAKAKAERPIFITSLPRAGTTIVLETLHRLPGIATHTYRDMPFVLTPVLWSRLSGGFRRHGSHRERSHGDGLAINEDSPEAFEEVLWHKYYCYKYNDNNITLWQAQESQANFVRFLRSHMKKIVSLRQPLRLADARYVSKNNNNIARVMALQQMFPDASILIPLRHPIEHAISLWRQHQNFSRQHAVDPFMLKYMADIGHYEFGALHRPITFFGLNELLEGQGPESIDYWLAYWIVAFEHLATQQGIFFVSYESLCVRGADGLAQLCQRLDINADDIAIAQAARILHDPPPNRRDEYCLAKDLSGRAMTLYGRLRQQCVLDI